MRGPLQLPLSSCRGSFMRYSDLWQHVRSASVSALFLSFSLPSRRQCCSVAAVQPRSIDPSKDLATYRYGSMSWKERMEGWKRKQERMQQLRSEGGGDWDGDGDADLPL